MSKLENMKHEKGFAKIYSYGQLDKSFFMSMELMGPSLADLF